MDYPEALEYLGSFANYERRSDWEYPESIKLDRMRALAKAFGNPQNAFDSVIVAGSKGKGSTSAFVASILRMENLRVGLYTSPHLLDVRERIRVNGLLIPENRLTEDLHLLRRTLDDYAWRKDPPTYFEVLTVIAFHHFREMKVQVAVLEVGMGGLHDSTNIAPAKAVAIAPVSLEHTDRLGKTVAKIAVQKAGVIKGREVVVSAPQVPEADAVIQDAAREREAELFRVGRELQVLERSHDEHGQRFDVKGPLGSFFDLGIKLLGRHQIDNAAVAAGVVKGLEKKTRWRISESSIRHGLADARWPGRLEKAADHPLVVLDGAHNADSLARALEGLRRHFHFDKLHVVLGVSADKDTTPMLELLASEAASVWTTRSTNPRSLEAPELARRAAEAGLDPLLESDPGKAVLAARSQAGSADAVLVTGSLFLVADAKRFLGESW